jgi:polyisoprenoid-binding protein YceI
MFSTMKNFLMFSLLALIALTSSTLNTPAPTYKVDVAKSTFKWTGKKVTGSHWGYIKFTGGDITATKKGITGGTLTVDMNSMDCQDLKGGGAEKLIGHLKGDDFFGTEKFPTSTLVIKSVTPKTGTEYDVKADLTIKGVTSEVAFPATITMAGNELTATANFNVDRTKHGIKYGSGSFFDNLGDKAIDNNFNVDINLVAVGDAAAAPAKAAKAKAKAKAPAKKTATSK